MTEPKLLNFILSDLLNAITVDEIVSNDLKTKELLIDGKAVTQNELTQLQAEIKAIEGFRIWQLMYNTTKHHAEERIFTKSMSMDDIHFGKAMLYNLSLQDSIIKALKGKKL